MRLPESLLSHLRGPLAAVAIAGCSAPAAPAVVPAPQPTPIVLAPAAPPDPVPYDAIAEAARLDRSDRELTTQLARRDERIQTAERAQASQSIGTLGNTRWNSAILAACGRG